MSDGRIEFSERLARLTRRHRLLAQGYIAVLRGDGLVVLEPRRMHFKLPVRGFVLLMAIFMVFKGFMLYGLGSELYYERLMILSGGTLYEQIGAFLMGIDPVSQAIGDMLTTISGG